MSTALAPVLTPVLTPAPASVRIPRPRGPVDVTRFQAEVDAALAAFAIDVSG